MLKATYSDKDLVIDILTRAFINNKSVNYIVKQDNKRIERVRALMNYSFEICHRFGNVFLTQDKKSCALLLFPDQKKTNLTTIYLDLKLVLFSLGINNIRKVLTRESKIKKLRPKEGIYYLWFIAVDPYYQKQGLGAHLLNNIIQEGSRLKRSVYLETSTLANIPWYQKFGFEIYNKLHLHYELFFLKRMIKP
jgi:ribosomal protein S18 acetylase RimI-like enzyme